MKRFVLCAAALLMASCHGTRDTRSDPLPGFPRLVLWAWERPEDFGFLPPQSAGVAFLVRTISWSKGEMSSRPRLQPLHVPAGTPLITVVRLESGGEPLPDAAAVALEAAKAGQMEGSEIRALQVDFDAKRSEREWYRGMLARLRETLPSNLPLTITALASWCESDGWIANLPLSDAVPMLFRMGSGERFPPGDFRVGLCRSSVGLSTDEIPPAVPRGRRIFVFNPRPWSETAYRWARENVRKWQ